MTEVNNSQDTLDSRDIIARIEELTEERDDLQSTLDDLEEEGGAGYEEAKKALDDWISEYADELAALEALAEQASSYGDWEHGATLIRDDHFTTWAEEYAGEIGAISEDAKWPLNHIDWDAAATELLHDYMEVDFDGVAYQMRA